MNNPFQAVRTHWLAKIHKGVEAKKDFNETADECRKFYAGPYDFMYEPETFSKGAMIFRGDHGTFPTPTFGMTVNKAAEMVQLFGPSLYSRNPVFRITPRKQKPPPPFAFGNPSDPQVQMMWQQSMLQNQQAQGMDMYRASMLEDYLAYIPNALDLKGESRKVIDETLITGMGVWWVEPYRPPGSPWQVMGAFYDTQDNFVADPDGEAISEAKWIARRFVRPIWQVEAEYNLPRGTIKGTSESQGANAINELDPSVGYKRARGETNDLCVYWKIYSKMGMGSLLSGAGKASEDIEVLGQYCMLVVTESCPFPLNLPEEILANPQAAQQAVQWDTPFWMDDMWPCKVLGFHWTPRKMYPMAHLKPALGELRFMNWACSFIASKMANGARDFIAIKQAAGEEIKRAIISGRDYEIISIKESLGPIGDVVQFLQHPEFQGDFWKVYEKVEENFEKRVGLNELMYGTASTQSRSASDSQLKGEAMKIRPDDMANIVEDAMGDLGRMIAFAAKWHSEPQRDIIPILGQQAAHFWEQLITAQDPTMIIHQMEYRVEAGSIRKPNHAKDQQDATAAMQTLGPTYWQYATMTGNTGPYNNVTAMWAKASQLDPEQFALPQLPPPMPVAAPPGSQQGQQGKAA